VPGGQDGLARVTKIPDDRPLRTLPMHTDELAAEPLPAS